MNLERILEIGIDGSGRLYVTPEVETFPFVYRAGMEVSWDQTGHSLYSPAPREWSYPQWFRQIVSAVASEYGYTLLITPETRWQAIAAADQTAILSGIDVRDV